MKIFFFFVSIGFCIGSYAQSNFLEQLEQIGINSKVPNEFAIEYFGAKKNYYGGYFRYELDFIGNQCGDSVLFIYSVNHLVGSTSYLTIRSADGKKEHISFVVADHGDHDGTSATSKSTSYEFRDPQLLEVSFLTQTVKDKSKIREGTDWLVDGESYFDLETEAFYRYAYFQIDDCSIGVLSNKKKVNPDRAFPLASLKLLSADDLRGISREMLRIMRNEIFAAYGYKFKSQDLRDYFGETSWYVPKHDDVTAKLTDIEKANIQLILGHEK